MNTESKTSKGAVSKGAASTSTAAVAAKQAHALVRAKRQGLKATDDDISGSFDTEDRINVHKNEQKSTGDIA